MAVDTLLSATATQTSSEVSSVTQLGAATLGAQSLSVSFATASLALTLGIGAIVCVLSYIVTKSALKKH